MNPIYFGLLLGGIWAFAVFVIGLVAKQDDRLRRFVGLSRTIYFGFRPGLVGALIGAFWGFCDGFLSGAVIAMLFNFIHR